MNMKKMRNDFWLGLTRNARVNYEKKISPWVCIKNRGDIRKKNHKKNRTKK